MADPGSDHWSAAVIYPVCMDSAKSEAGKAEYGQRRENRQGKGSLWFYDRICSCIAYDTDTAEVYVAVCRALCGIAFGLSALSAH